MGRFIRDVVLGGLRLTWRQHKVLTLLAAFFAKHDQYPAAQDIADDLKVSVNTVWHALNALKAKELLTSTYGTHRSLRLTQKGKDVLASVSTAQAQASNDNVEAASAVA